MSIPPQGSLRATLHFVFELVVTAGIVGAIAGWYFGHKPQATVATALAGLAYALGPGHNIPLLGNTPAVGKGIVLLFVIILISAFILVEVSARISGGVAQ